MAQREELQQLVEPKHLIAVLLTDTKPKPTLTYQNPIINYYEISNINSLYSVFFGSFIHDAVMCGFLRGEK